MVGLETSTSSQANLRMINFHKWLPWISYYDWLNIFLGICMFITLLYAWVSINAYTRGGGGAHFLSDHHDFSHIRVAMFYSWSSMKEDMKTGNFWPYFGYFDATYGHIYAISSINTQKYPCFASKWAKDRGKTFSFRYYL